MGTFNAGAIEAHLTLDRSSWTADLRKTREEIADLERQSISIGINLDDDQIVAEIERLDAMFEALDEENPTIAVELDTDFIQEQLEWLDAEFDRLDGRKVTIEIDVDDTNAQIALDNLERGQLDVLEADDIVIDVRTDINDRELDALEARLDRLERQRWVIEVDVDADNAYVQFSELEAFLDLLDRDKVVITVDVDSAAAEAKLIALATFINAIAISDPTVRFDIDGYSTAIAQLVTLEGQIAVLDGREIDIDIDMDRAALRNLVGPAGGDGSGGSMGLLRILIYALIALSPILVVAMSAASAAVVGFAAALVAALGPAIIVAGGLVGLIQRFNDTPIEDRSPEMQAFADSIEAVKDAWQTTLDLAEKSGAFQLMADALNLVADVLPRLEPVFSATVDMLDGVVEGLGNFVGSPEFDRMIDFFAGFGVDMLETFLQIGGNLLRFFGRLFEAIAPFASQMMQGLEDATAGWMDWANGLENNTGFQDWLDRALEYGPRVLDFFGSLWDALMNIAEALEPFAGPMLDAFIWFFDFIANIDPTVLTIVIGLLAGLWLGMNVLLPVITGLITVFPLLVSAIGFLLSPIGLVVLAIAGLVATIIYLWQTNEDFRNGIIKTWNEIVEFLTPIVEDIVALIRDNWGPIVEWAKGIWEDVQGTVMDAFTIIEQIIRGTLRAIGFVWTHFGEDIIRIIKGAAQVIGSNLRGLMGIIRGIFQVISGIMTGNWSKAWEGIKKIYNSAKDAVTGSLNGLKNVWGGIFSAIGTVIRNSWNNSMEAIKTALRLAKQFITEKWNDLKASFLNPIQGIGTIFSGLREGFKGVINDIIGWWNGFSLSLDIPDKIPGLPDSFTISTPNIDYLATGGYVTSPTLAVVGEGPDNEVVAPEPMLRQIVRENSGANLDYGMLAAAVASALRSAGVGGVSQEDLERLIEAASVNIEVDARSEGDKAEDFARELAFQMRVLGYGGRRAA